MFWISDLSEFLLLQKENGNSNMFCKFQLHRDFSKWQFKMFQNIPLSWTLITFLFIRATGQWGKTKQNKTKQTYLSFSKVTNLSLNELIYISTILTLKKKTKTNKQTKTKQKVCSTRGKSQLRFRWFNNTKSSFSQISIKTLWKKKMLEIMTSSPMTFLPSILCKISLLFLLFPHFLAFSVYSLFSSTSLSKPGYKGSSVKITKLSKAIYYLATVISSR